MTAERFFELRRNGTSVRTELLAGLTTSVPAFAILAGIPLTCSIADGLALGFLAYPVGKLLAGRGGQAPTLLKGPAVVLALYFVLVRGAL